MKFIHFETGQHISLIGNCKTGCCHGLLVLIVLILGHFETMENVTVNAYCSMTIDHYVPTISRIDHLDIKTFGDMSVRTDNEAMTTILGTTLTVRSGAKVRNTQITRNLTFVQSLLSKLN